MEAQQACWSCCCKAGCAHKQYCWSVWVAFNNAADVPCCAACCVSLCSPAACSLQQAGVHAQLQPLIAQSAELCVQLPAIA